MFIIFKGWVKCNGDVIIEPSSIWNGQKTPDLNGDNLYLRGGEDAEILTVQEDTVKNHQHEDHEHTHEDGGHSHFYDDRYTWRTDFTSPGSPDWTSPGRSDEDAVAVR